MFSLSEVTGEPVAGGVKYESSLTGSAKADGPKVKGEPSATIGRTSLVRQRKVGLGILYLGSPRPAPSPFPSHNGTSSPPSPPSVRITSRGPNVEYERTPRGARSWPQQHEDRS